MQKKQFMRLAPLACALALTGMTSSVHAAGFALIDQSASMLGNAFAGGSAAAYDSSTIYYNPAGMMRLDKGDQIVAGLTFVRPVTDFTNEGSTDWDGNPLTGPNSSGGVTAFVPNFYWTTDINDGDAKFGLGINVPFGLSTKYDDDWVGRYHAIDSEVQTLNINPSFAFDLTDKLAAGFGINIQYVDAKLSSAISYDNAPPAGIFSGDGTIENKGDGVGFGFNFGFLYTTDMGTRLGLAYRSMINHRVDGTVTYTNGQQPAGPLTAFNNGDANAELTLPETVSASFYHDINDKWAWMGDYTWTRWSRFQELTFNYPGNITGSGTNTYNWEDSSRFALGANYKFTPAFMLRLGAAYDNTPIPSPELRAARVPGNDRTWASIGFNWQASKTVGVDVGYSHLFVDDTEINNQESAPPGATLIGTYDSSVDIISAGIVWDF